MTTQSAETSAFVRRIERTERVISVVRTLADRQDGPVRNHRVWKKMLYRLIQLLNRLAREAAAAEAQAKPKPAPIVVKPARVAATPAAQPAEEPAAPDSTHQGVAEKPAPQAQEMTAPAKPPAPAQPRPVAEAPVRVAEPAVPSEKAREEDPKPAPAPNPAETQVAADPTPEVKAPVQARSPQAPTRAEFAQFGTLENAGRVISTNAWTSHSYHIGTQNIDYNTTQMMAAYNDIDADLNRDLDRAGNVQDRESVRATGVSERWASDKTEEDWEEGEEAERPLA